ncbi:hypothetical protein IIC38_16835 [candidate division KSB1 bacterium]|nr:hypothetical protein [candidate division KSB1 bacterium]
MSDLLDLLFGNLIFRICDLFVFCVFLSGIRQERETANGNGENHKGTESQSSKDMKCEMANGNLSGFRNLRGLVLVDSDKSPLEQTFLSVLLVSKAQSCNFWILYIAI